MSLLLVAASIFGQASASSRKVLPSQSITVTPDDANDETRAWERCDSLIKQARQLAGEKEFDTAFRLLEQAQPMAERYPSLRMFRSSIMETRAEIYLETGRARESASIYGVLVAEAEPYCSRKEQSDASGQICGNAHLNFANALYLAGNFSESYSSFEIAAKNLKEDAKEPKEWISELARIQLSVKLAEAKFGAGLAAARLGKRPEAVAHLDSAIADLEFVLAQPIATPQTKSVAAQLLEFARSQKDRL